MWRKRGRLVAQRRIDEQGGQSAGRNGRLGDLGRRVCSVVDLGDKLGLESVQFEGQRIRIRIKEHEVEEKWRPSERRDFIKKGARRCKLPQLRRGQKVAPSRGLIGHSSRGRPGSSAWRLIGLALMSLTMALLVSLQWSQLANGEYTFCVCLETYTLDQLETILELNRERASETSNGKE